MKKLFRRISHPRLVALCVTGGLFYLSAFAADSPAVEKAAPDPAAVAKAKADSPVEKLGWKAGPTTGELRDRARIKVPEGFRFVESGDAGKLLVMMGNRSTGRELGFLQNIKDKWAVVFEFDDVGFVKDDDKDKLDADKLLKTIKEGTEQGNKYREERGIPPMTILGWHVKPNFNDQTKNLEWSILAESDNRKFVNYNVRLLGRKGVTEITLINSLDEVDASLPAFRELIKDFSYKSGEAYAEYRAGDKMAKYGLGALVVGGAAAVAYKVGFLGMILAFAKKIWKLVIVTLVVLGGWIKNLITGRSSRNRQN